MKKEYSKPIIKVENICSSANILESTYIGEGYGDLDAKSIFGHWAIEEEEEEED